MSAAELMGPVKATPTGTGERMGESLVVTSQQQSAMVRGADPYTPDTFERAWHLAKIIVQSRLAPNLNTPEAAFLVLATGYELGLSAMQAIRAINIIDGKPSLSADLIVALVLRSGKCEFFREIESTSVQATYETKRKGSGEAVRATFTLENAKAAGLLDKKNWKSYPTVMLAHRAATMLARKVYPDVALGLFDPDELGSESNAHAFANASICNDVALPCPCPITKEEVVAVEPAPEPPPTQLEEEESNASPWANAMRTAQSMKELGQAANAALKAGVPRIDVTPVYEECRKSLKARAA